MIKSLNIVNCEHCSKLEIGHYEQILILPQYLQLPSAKIIVTERVTVGKGSNAY